MHIEHRKLFKKKKLKIDLIVSPSINYFFVIWLRISFVYVTCCDVLSKINRIHLYIFFNLNTFCWRWADYLPSTLNHYNQALFVSLEHELMHCFVFGFIEFSYHYCCIHLLNYSKWIAVIGNQSADHWIYLIRCNWSSQIYFGN